MPHTSWKVKLQALWSPPGGWKTYRFISSCDHDNIETVLLMRYHDIDNIVTSLEDSKDRNIIIGSLIWNLIIWFRIWFWIWHKCALFVKKIIFVCELIVCESWRSVGMSSEDAIRWGLVHDDATQNEILKTYFFVVSLLIFSVLQMSGGDQTSAERIWMKARQWSQRIISDVSWAGL